MGFFFLHILVHRKNVIIICLAQCPQAGNGGKIRGCPSPPHRFLKERKKTRENSIKKIEDKKQLKNCNQKRN